MKIIDKGKNYKTYALIFPNKKIYVGYTGESDIETRIKKGYNHNKRITQALREYGAETEKVILADNLTKAEAEQMEIYFVSHYQTTNRRKGYNYSTGGAAGRKGCRLTAKQRAAISGDNNPRRIAEARKKIDRAIERLHKALTFNPADILKQTQIKPLEAWRYKPIDKQLENTLDIDKRLERLANPTAEIERALQRINNLDFDFNIQGKIDTAIEEYRHLHQ